ncbi:MAG TPA: ABC transporter substrate-binding protein [Candidatus Limnocylindrales bacterium]|nr:ABC transporter substrate-binding protein [Candidatus Limnocylindrales bacterium]
MTGKTKWLLASVFVAVVSYAGALCAAAPTPMLIAYGGHNETMIPIWVGADKGLFRKYGIDLRALQTRSGPIMMATLVSGGAPLVWSAPSSALSTTVSGLKLGCFNVGNNRVPREVIARKGIESLEDLRGKTFGVQSIGGGFWLSTMVVLDALGIDPDKYKLNMRVIGDTGTVTQALITGNVDAMVVPYSYSDMAKRAGAKSLADAGKLNVVYQATVMCAHKDSSAISQETMLALTKGIVESLVYILDPANKRDVSEILKKNLRLSKDEDVEASYRVSRLQMPNIDVALNPDAWRTVKRIVSKVNPKVQEVDLDQVIVNGPVQSLESIGFLPEMRKKLPR